MLECLKFQNVRIKDTRCLTLQFMHDEENSCAQQSVIYFTCLLTLCLIVLQQMELLILSKLKWDLTAVTAYDYLDHLMNTVTSDVTEEETSSSPSTSWDRQTTSTVRSLAERIVLLCATDAYFATVSPSLIASAAFVAAVQNASSLPQSTSQRSRIIRRINLNTVTARLKSVAKFDTVSHFFLFFFLCHQIMYKNRTHRGVFLNEYLKQIICATYLEHREQYEKCIHSLYQQCHLLSLLFLKTTNKYIFDKEELTLH